MKSAITALIVACVVGFPAIAHENPADWDWIGKERRKNDKGDLCCGRGVDCKEWPASAIKVSPEGYTFPNGQFVPVDKMAPSADEFAHQCIWGGEVKCSFYPMGSM